MEADRDSTSLRYTECWWGDLIYGSKEQLQALGLGIGRAFPGELGGPKRVLSVHDPRGYIAKLESRDDGIFCASIRFPHVPERPRIAARQAFPGVMVTAGPWADEYTGSVEALIAAGLVQASQLPGMPGMRSVRVRIYADGSMPGGPRNSPHETRLKDPGAREIERVSKSSFRVSIYVTPEEHRRRQEASNEAEEAHIRLARALPRPPRLQPMAHSKWARFEEARANAARDVAFQGVLARLVSDARRPST
jgi:hypothetical protein